MPPAHLGVSNRVIALLERDDAVRSRLAESGDLFGGYHPDMEAVHIANAMELDRLLQGEWPSLRDVVAEVQDAAWTIVQHAISLPSLQRRYLSAIRVAVAAGQAPGWQEAMLEDRIRSFEGRPQRYGTQFDWDDAGELSPLAIEERETVDIRRAALGLPPLSIAVARQRELAASENHHPPADILKYQAERDAWAVRTGWRS
jgi:hypothetical protein